LWTVAINEWTFEPFKAGTAAVRERAGRVQPGARRHGIAGIHGNRGIVESVSYRF
jgi:hypothetical protein